MSIAADTTDLNVTLDLTPADVCLLIDALAALHMRGRREDIHDFIARHPQVTIFTRQPEPIAEEDR